MNHIINERRKNKRIKNEIIKNECMKNERIKNKREKYNWSHIDMHCWPSTVHVSISHFYKLYLQIPILSVFLYPTYFCLSYLYTSHMAKSILSVPIFYTLCLCLSPSILSLYFLNFHCLSCLYISFSWAYICLSYLQLCNPHISVCPISSYLYISVYSVCIYLSIYIFLFYLYLSIYVSIQPAALKGWLTFYLLSGTRKQCCNVIVG